MVAIDLKSLINRLDDCLISQAVELRIRYVRNSALEDSNFVAGALRASARSCLDDCEPAAC